VKGRGAEQNGEDNLEKKRNVGRGGGDRRHKTQIFILNKLTVVQSNDSKVEIKIGEDRQATARAWVESQKQERPRPSLG
jgi:hypothetical protein